MNRRTCIILVGPPCSGKSSTGKVVAEKLNIGYISSGDIARQMAQHNSNIKNDLNMGKLAPEDNMRNTISSRLWQYFMIRDNDIIILDGFPRFGDQAKWLCELLYNANVNIKYVLFDIPLQTIIERSVHRSRDDDMNLEHRLEYYYNTTLKELGRYIDISIDANENTVGECSKLLIDFIEEVTNAKDR